MADKQRRSIEEIINDVENEVYKAVAPLYEEAEHADLIFGNGHHMAQKIAGEAKALIKERADSRAKAKAEKEATNSASKT